MGYKALARTYRPKTFTELVGQEHVKKALTNALKKDKVHHALLFTGTRGVGKTTIARILAKSLNCESGITQEPCCICSACKAIDEGRFLDLIEIDGASKTKVEDTRELLDNVPYAPTQGRFKVYLIDEVHMLSKHSFNALLKTLEEPPEHVKFVLATTDPEKIPATILSRCIQFHLRAISDPEIEGRIEDILEKEGVSSDQDSRRMIAAAANGSMRDALSLLDQAVAHCDGEITETAIREMLGAVSTEHVFNLIERSLSGNAYGALQIVEALASEGRDFNRVMEEMIDTLHRVAIAQVAPEWSAVSEKRIVGLSERYSTRLIHQCYQIMIEGRRDLPLAKDAKSGLEMSIVRVVAEINEHIGAGGGSGQGEQSHRNDAPQDQKTTEAVKASPKKQMPSNAADEYSEYEKIASTAQEPREQTKENRKERECKAPVTENNADAQQPESHTKEVQRKAEKHDETTEWSEIIGKLKIGGLSKELAMRSALVEKTEDKIRLDLKPDYEHLEANKRARERLENALSDLLKRPITLEISVGKCDKQTPSEIQAQAEKKRQEGAIESARNDEKMKSLIDDFGATIKEESIIPS